MPRPTWSGSIAFGLVNVPIKMYTAASSKDVRFHQLHDKDGARIEQRRFCRADGEEVTNDHLVRGYEVSRDRYVIMEPEDFEAVDPRGSKTIEIEEFVDLADIDPIYFENSYYLVPEKTAARAYSLLLAAMQESKKVGVGNVVLRQKQYLVAVRPTGNALSMSTLYYADEVVGQDDLEGLPGEDVKVAPKELTMARQLVESLSAEFEPEKYRDDYREKLLAIIERKAEGEEIVAPEVEEKPRKVVDLMAALEASIAAARGKPASEERKRPASIATAREKPAASGGRRPAKTKSA